jgi:Predicted acetyltransferases and hydrolases with the alpha/beta hydrolase fold
MYNCCSVNCKKTNTCRIKSNITTNCSKLVNIIRAIAVDIFLSIVIATKYWMRPMPHKSASASNAQITFFVHGYAHNSSAWSHWKKQISSHPVGEVRYITLKGSFQSIEVYSKQIQDEITKHHAGRKIQLVGHSMGGLVATHAAHALSQQAESPKVHKIVTIGTPFKGSPLSCFGLGKNAREMSSQSLFLNALQQKYTTLKELGTTFYHVASIADPLVPEDRALPKNADMQKTLILKDAGHVELLHLKSVKDFTLKALL